MASSSPTPARSEGLGGGLPAHAAPGSCSHTALVGGLPRGGSQLPAGAGTLLPGGRGCARPVPPGRGRGSPPPLPPSALTGGAGALHGGGPAR